MLRPPIRKSGSVAPKVAPTLRAEALTPLAPLRFRGFNGLTHLDTRNARNGNQFSNEPPDQALSVGTIPGVDPSLGKGFVLEAVNEALNVYSTAGVQQLPRPLALSEFFGLPAAIDRTTGVFGVSPFDPVSLYDPETERWFVLAVAQLNTPEGFRRAETRIYLGVSQTSDPTGAYTIYKFNTTKGPNPLSSPRLPDFPHIGIDRYGFYISVNEFTLDSDTGGITGFGNVAIFALSKQALITGSGGDKPTIVRFTLPFDSGYEFTIFPAHTPPGTSPFLGSGGAEFFVSSRFINDTENSLAVWALTNTSSLESAAPQLDLKAVAVRTQTYHFPTENAEQKKGFHPLGAAVGEPVAKIDSGDFRVLSAVYSAGRLWATLGSEITDDNGNQQMGAAYFAFLPRIEDGKLSARLDTQGVVSETGANLLRPAIAVNADNRGAMVFTLVGSNDFPSSAFVPIRAGTAGAIHISRAGNEPEDGFTGYMAFVGNTSRGARWGDYSAAAVDADGSIWMATEYTPDLARTTFANWSTYITRYRP